MCGMREKAGVVGIDAYGDYSDFRILTLSGFEYMIGSDMEGEAEIVELASKIRWLGAWRYTTKRVRYSSYRYLHGHDKLGELNVILIFDTDSRTFSLSRTMRGFRVSTSGHLKASAMYPILKQYIIKTNLAADGTIFEDV